ncbi:MAG: glutamate racemase [Verrucomicrobia bacterium]|nr:glutamate racemase [Verrucomicrobiota bacterium]
MRKPQRVNHHPIGIFDSGFGGLTVLRALHSLLPNEKFLYYADTANLPYGDKTPEEICHHSLSNAEFLFAHEIKLLVVACNTSCCAALDALRARSKVPVIGITEQGVQEVVERAKKSVALLATKATIASKFYQTEIASLRPDLEIHPIACPLLVPLIEKGHTDDLLITHALREHLRPLKNLSIDSALLGCTHYPLISNAIQRYLGKNVQLIDPALACAHSVQKHLLLHSLQSLDNTPQSPQFFVSGDPEKFNLFGAPIPTDTLIKEMP